MQLIIANYPWLMIVCGVIGLSMGVDRTARKHENESKGLQVLSVISGIVLSIIAVIMIFSGHDETSYSFLTVLIMILAGISMSARQLEKIPATAVIIVTAMITGAIAYAAGLIPEDTLWRLMSIATVVAVVLIVLLLSLAEIIVDQVLRIFGFGVVVIIISLIDLVHSISIIATGDEMGLLALIR